MMLGFGGCRDTLRASAENTSVRPQMPRRGKQSDKAEGLAKHSRGGKHTDAECRRN